MEHLSCELSYDKFDKAVHGGLDDNPVLAERGDLAVYIKPMATVLGNPMAVITFTVQLPDGSFARAQATTTTALLESVAGLIRGWKEAGRL
jgi:hypothetical protein